MSTGNRERGGGQAALGSRVEALQQALEALRETEERYRLAAQATDDVIWDWDFARNEIRWNDAVARRFGHTPHGMVTTVEWWKALLHPEDRAAVIGSIDAAVDSASPAWSAEYRFERADGSYAYVLDRGYIIRDADGRGVRMVGAILDFTERKIAEERLRESEENYRYTVELSPQFPWTADPDGSNIEVKRPLSSRIAAPIEQFLHPDDLNYHRQKWAEALRSGTPYHAEYRFQQADGSYRWMRSRAYPRLDEDGKIVRWYGLAEDIHKERVAEQQLQRLQDELLQVARVSAMGTLASAVAHEINQPLTAIANYMAGSKQLLATSGLAAKDVVIEALEQAAKSAVQAGEIVRRLRDLVVQGEVEMQPVDLMELAKETYELTAGETRKRGTDVSLEFGPEAQHALGDRIQVQQVLVNLIRNAAEAMEASPARMLRLRTDPAPENRIRIRVEDTGPGVSPEIRRHLFTPFVSSKEKGMGVGLAICRSIIEAHGGEIWVEDLPGGGAAFCFTLACATSESSNA